MIKGEKIRFDIHNILFAIYKYNKTLNNTSIKKIIQSHNSEDLAFLNNVTLNSMRLHLHSLKIINKYIKKKIRDHEKILLISAITQIVFLNFKEYAVINCSVEIAKKLRLYPGLINASLKKIARNKNYLKETRIVYDDLPIWFRRNTTYLSINEKKKFLKNFFKEPDLHIVFKNIKSFENFEETLIKTSDISGFLLDKKNIKNKKSFIKGEWWVQDFCSFFPIYNFHFKNVRLKILDSCAAPGGKSFQLLSNNFKVVLNDKSRLRIETLKNNLKRLNFKAKIINKDFIKFEEDKKFDIIILDVPCSAVGTIRKNPEIFFKNEAPDFAQLNFLQKSMLNKASNLLNKGGFIIYMTCSFLKNETVDQINNFLEENGNFSLSKFEIKENNINYSKLIKNDFMMTIPDNVLNFNIDGYFSAYLRKIK